MSQYIQPEEIEKLIQRVSVLDYFRYLEDKGIVRFDKNYGKDHYFLTDDNKYSVTDDKFYDFKTEKGGKIIKAVITLEDKNWKDAVDFLSEFKNVTPIHSATISFENAIKLTLNKTIQPNNERLIRYFQDRGISKNILNKFTKEVHFQSGNKNYFGLGMVNKSGGYEVRNPFMKTKIGNNDISIIHCDKANELVVFEGLMDMLSFLQLMKNNGKVNNRTLISLNSVTNTESFIHHYKNFEGKIYLLLDADIAGTEATTKIKKEVFKADVKDIRPLYYIQQGRNNDLNDYLQDKKRTLVQSNSNHNGKHTIKSRTTSDSQQMGKENAEQNPRKLSQESQPKQNENKRAGQTMGSENARNGLESTKRKHPNTGNTSKSLAGTQQGDIEKQENELDRGLLNSTNHIEIDALLTLTHNRKYTNKEVAEIVSAASFALENKEVQLKENLIVTDELKNVCHQFTSGGKTKDGRGVLDEYYTDTRIVDAIHNLIKENFKGKNSINVLEPSIGTGNFVSAVQKLGIKTYITGFEINETTAKIAKILYPNITVYNRPFETEFITENGTKKDKSTFENKYDLVIGNPPYGEHRGLYKGLGEESKIAKYEDYFLKRSLDVLKDRGILAMVLPSGWLNRQRKLSGAELKNAFRLPEGAFKDTKIGTDIIILKKNAQIQKHDISQYFDENPDKILGEIREKSNRFGRMEKYVYGSLDDALQEIQHSLDKAEVWKQGNLFDDFIESPIQQTSKKVTIPFHKHETTQIDFPNIKDLEEKVHRVLDYLNNLKFQSPVIQKEIIKYRQLKVDLEQTPEVFHANKIQTLLVKANKLLTQSEEKSSNEYSVQSKPDIKKGILKYQFNKKDEIVFSSLQNNPNISKEMLEAFQDTAYDGTLSNREKHHKFANYINGKWVHDFYYAEGNIYEKLEMLAKNFENKKIDEKQLNKQAFLLGKVLPKPKILEDIIISPNHEFVHSFQVGEMEREIYNYDKKEYETEVYQASLADKFKTFVDTLSNDAFAGSSAWEVKNYVDNLTVTGSDKDRNALIRERRKAAANDLFNKFIREELSEDLRDKYVKDFNRFYNNIHVPDYSNFPMFSKIHKNFKGSDLRLTEVQKAGIGRLTTKGVGLLAHEVGFGKTLSGILAMHEAMERGTAKRPLIVVPNDSILKQWVETIYETIPNAKVNVLGNLGVKYDLSNFEIYDNEISIVTYSGFNNIGFSAEITSDLADKFSYITENELKSITNTSEREKQIEIQKEQEVQGKMLKGKVYDWEDFGFDHLTFDEVHNANHIVGKVRIEDRRFASDFRNQSQRTSGLGINTWMAAQYIQEKNNGRNVTLLSATPFTNKPLEYYSVLSLVANKRLEQSGYFNVNNFFETFMEADNEMEIDAKGDIKYKTNVRRFKNNALFQKLLSEFIDIKGEDDNPELIRPNRINKEYKIEQNDVTKEQYELLNDNYSETEDGAILTHILNARLIAISPYLSVYYHEKNPSDKEFIENSPKLKTTMELIAQNKKDKAEAGQIIYSELAIKEFPKIKDYLVKEVGYDPKEVAIITGATSRAKRISIQNDFNAGKIKIVIGSEAIQEGMNLQGNTTDMYMLSLPYNFTSLRQTEGRAWRQGNKWENVRINYMLTNDSIDVFMLQKLQAKQARYLEAMKKDVNILDISDVNTQELKTSLITNPETRANIEIEIEKKRLENEKNKLLADAAFVLRKYNDYLKVHEKLNVAKLDYAKYKLWAKDNAYWKNQLPIYKTKISNVEKEVEEVMLKLAQKGVNVAEIEKQKDATQSKIDTIEKQIEDLDTVKIDLVEKYQQEKKERLEKAYAQDFVKERAIENQNFFQLKIHHTVQNSQRKR